jgi:hypothetical protein
VAGTLALAATRVAEGKRAEEAIVEAECVRVRVHTAEAAVAARGMSALVEAEREAEREATACDIATVGLTAGPFLRHYLTAADLIAEADDVAMAKVEVVAAAQPQEAEDDGLFDDEKVAPATSNEQAVLLASTSRKWALGLDPLVPASIWAGTKGPATSPQIRQPPGRLWSWPVTSL